MFGLKSILAATVIVGLAAVGLPAMACEDCDDDWSDGDWTYDQYEGGGYDYAPSYDDTTIHDGGGGTGEYNLQGDWSYYSNTGGYSVGGTGDGCIYTPDWSNC